MALKIAPNKSAVAHHIIDGAWTFPYVIDADSAVARFPAEWSHEPWPESDRAAARQEAGQPEIELTPEEQAAIDEHAKAVAEANERLAKFRAEQEEKRKIDEQVAADEALVKSAPPRPDPNRPKRPFGRPGEPTPAERAAIEKREKKKADDERIAREKAEQDRMNNSNAKMTT